MSCVVAGKTSARDVAYSLAILVSEIADGAYANKVISFSSRAKYFDLSNCSSLRNKYNILLRNSIVDDTNIQSVFQLILDTATGHKLTDDDIVKRVIIISDMQFNEAQSGKTNFDVIDSSFKKYGYTRPQLVFWNLDGKFQDSPVTIDTTGTVLISGFSPMVLKYLQDGTDITPWSIVLNTLNAERYKDVRDALGVSEIA
jgi:hypothetical protein